jgi:hypothetical protein
MAVFGVSFVGLNLMRDPDVVAAAPPHLIAALQRHWPARAGGLTARAETYVRYLGAPSLSTLIPTIDSRHDGSRTS